MSIMQATLDFLRNRKKAYSLIFSQPAGQEVLNDLLKFSHYLEGPVGKTDSETMRLIGRQDVLRRIHQHMNLKPDQLFALYNGQVLTPNTGNGD